MANFNVSIFLILALLLSALPHKGADDYVPVSPVQHRAVADVINVVHEETKVCSNCTCCAISDPSKCSTRKCCYQIKCNQDKPFGHCSYKPISCNCNNCN